jgi:2-hydroxy-3-keto-5-methylthiopentenyl-1-phosphate phosphatase
MSVLSLQFSSTLSIKGSNESTIFVQDTGHILFNNFSCGSERRKILDEQIHSGERSFRDVSEEMWGSLDMPFDDGFA